MPPNSSWRTWLQTSLLPLVIFCLNCSKRAVAFETGEIELHEWIRNPIARHVACPVDVNTPTVCRLAGYEDGGEPFECHIKSLPKAGLLYETSSNFRTFGSDPKHAPDPIGEHLLPFLVTDPLHRIVYAPPSNLWPPEGNWSMFTYTATFQPRPLTPIAPSPAPVTSEEGIVVLANPEGAVAGSSFDLGDDGGWSVSGNLAGGDPGRAGLKHQAFVWGSLSHYVYGVDEVQFLDFETRVDKRKWYFEASPFRFHRPELAAVYGGYLRFTARLLYGNFSELNSPLDWITLECEACDSGHGIRLVRFTDDLVYWDGSESTLRFALAPSGRWMRDPLNAAMDFTYADECAIAAVLTNLSRVAILGDFTRAGEGVAIDDVAMVAADMTAQPTYPIVCQKGCVCKHNTGVIRPMCC